MSEQVVWECIVPQLEPAGSGTCMQACSTFAPVHVRPLFAPRSPVWQVNMEVEVRWVQDMLKGDECYEMRLKLKEHRDEKFPYKDDD